MMRQHSFAFVAFFAVFASACCDCASETNVAPAGFISLFDGKTIDTTTWTGGTTFDPREISAKSVDEKKAWFAEHDANVAKNWSVDKEKGELVSNGEGSFLTTRKDYGDFELWVDWKLMKDNGDSGIYLRGAPQVQIWNPDNPAEIKNGAANGSGGLWNNMTHERFPLARKDHKIGEWNRFHITMVGAHVKVELNGTLVTDTQMDNDYFNQENGKKESLLPAAPLQLQTHGSEVRFRNIFVRELK